MDNKKLQTDLARITDELAYDRAALDELHGQMAEQTAEVAGVSQRLGELVGDMTRTQARLAQLDALQKAIGQVRADLVGLMDEQSKRLSADVAAIRSGDAAQMERVTQSTAATAEESAAASEELSAQANTTMEVVGQLQALVGGGGSAPRISAPRASLGKTMAKVIPLASRKSKASAPAAHRSSEDEFPLEQAGTGTFGSF